MFRWLRRRRQVGTPDHIDPKELLATADNLRLDAMRTSAPRPFRSALVAADLATRACRDPADVAVAWSILCVLHRTAATRSGEYGGLDDAEQAGRRGLDIAPAGTQQWFRCASALSTVLLERHLRLDDQTALGEAVDLNRRIVAELDIDSPEYPGMLGNLTNALKLLHGVRRDPALIEEAVVIAREAVDLVRTGSPHFATVRINLASALAVQLGHTLSPTILHEARGHLRTALRAMPPGHPDLPAVLNLTAQLDKVADLL